MRQELMRLGKIPVYAGGIFCLLVVGYLFARGIQEAKYLQIYSDAADIVCEANTFLSTGLKAEALEGAVREKAAGEAGRYLKEVRASLRLFTEGAPFPNYEDEHQAVTELLKHEAEMLRLTEELLRQPQSPDTGRKLAGLRENIEYIKRVTAGVMVQNAEFEIRTDLMRLHRELSRLAGGQPVPENKKQGNKGTTVTGRR